MIPNELSHGPGFESGAVLAEATEGSDQNANQFIFGFPKIGQEFPFLFWSQEVR